MAKRKDTPLNNIAIKNNGLINLNNGIPEDLIATSSKLSPSLPNVIIEESKIAIGNASITIVALAYKINFERVNMSRPFPTRSSIYFQIVCIIKTNKAIKNVARKGQKNAFRISISNFFITGSTLTLL